MKYKKTYRLKLTFLIECDKIIIVRFIFWENNENINNRVNYSNEKKLHYQGSSGTSSRKGLVYRCRFNSVCDTGPFRIKICYE